jgi:O-antigen/teichoic acid export membrane protein
MKKKQMYFNLLAQLISFCVSFAISFFVSPIIVKEVGKETYGFLGLANNFVGYVTIITVALNSLAGRFVTVSLHKNDEDSANRYFSSVFFANLIVVAVLLIPATVFICFLEKFFDMPVQSILSIKITFGVDMKKRSAVFSFRFL